MKGAITLQGVSKSYGRVRALKDVTVSVPESSALAVLGENGAGKTTMIRIILGLTLPDTGAVQIQGISSGNHLARRSVRYLPERVQFPEWATPTDVFRHMERIRKESTPDEFMERANELNCADLLKRKFGKMSKGQRQRLALALTTSGNPRIAILDEPSSGLDPLGRILVRKTVAKLVERGTTILLCSHLLGEVEQVCSHAAFLSKGCLVAHDSLDRLARFTGAAEVQTDKPQELASFLTQRGFVCRAEQSAVVAALEEGASLHLLAAATAEAGIPFISIAMKRETLEDVFMRVTEGRDSNVS
jgi:ABC-type multidrug transport system ATPase subunit